MQLKNNVKVLHCNSLCVFLLNSRIVIVWIGHQGSVYCNVWYDLTSICFPALNVFSYLLINNNCGFHQELLFSSLLYKVLTIFQMSGHRNLCWVIYSVNEHCIEHVIRQEDPHDICAAELHRKLHRFDGNTSTFEGSMYLLVYYLKKLIEWFVHLPYSQICLRNSPVHRIPQILR